MKILFADDGADIRELVKLTLESYFDSEVLLFKDGNSLISYLDEHHNDMAIIICDYNMPNGSGTDVYQYVIDKDIDYPFILISSHCPSELSGLEKFYQSSRTNVFVQKPEELLFLYSTVEDVCLRHYRENCPLFRVDYVPISPILLQRLGVPSVDYYYKIAVRKYVKVVSRGDDECLDIIMKFKNSNKKLFVMHSEFDTFISSSYRVICDPDSSQMTREQRELSAVEFAQSTLKSLGLSDALINLSGKVVDSVLDRLKSDHALKNSIDQLLLQEDHFLYKHSVLVSYLAVSLLQYTPWKTRSADRKLCVAAFFHDAFLNEADYDKFEFASYTPYPSEQTQKISTRYISHPYRAAKVFLSFDISYGDIAKIIEQHHEKPDGSGFPRGLFGTKIFNLAAIFIISELVTHYILNCGIDQQEMNRWFEVIRRDYSDGPFSRAVEAMSSVIGMLDN